MMNEAMIESMKGFMEFIKKITALLMTQLSAAGIGVSEVPDYSKQLEDALNPDSSYVVDVENFDASEYFLDWGYVRQFNGDPYAASQICIDRDNVLNVAFSNEVDSRIKVATVAVVSELNKVFDIINPNISLKMVSSSKLDESDIRIGYNANSKSKNVMETQNHDDKRITNYDADSVFMRRNYAMTDHTNATIDINKSSDKLTDSQLYLHLMREFLNALGLQEYDKYTVVELTDDISGSSVRSSFMINSVIDGDKDGYYAGLAKSDEGLKLTPTDYVTLAKIYSPYAMKYNGSVRMDPMEDVIYETENYSNEEEYMQYIEKMMSSVCYSQETLDEYGLDALYRYAKGCRVENREEYMKTEEYAKLKDRFADYDIDQVVVREEIIAAG